MANDTSNYEFKCPDCGWTIPADEIKQKTGYKEQIYFCEQCGAKLIKWAENEFGEQIPIEQEPNAKEKLFPIEIIATDPDLTAGFIDDLTLVLARMIYVNIRMLEKSRKVVIENMEFDEVLLNYIADTIMPVLDKKINPHFLKELKRLTLDQFNTNMRKLHMKLIEIQIYRQNFIIYYRWLIKEVFFLVSQSWNKIDLEQFDLIILNDLKHYEFDEIYKLIEIAKLEESAEDLEFNDVTEKFSSVINVQKDNLDQFKQFLQFTHGYAFLKDFIIKFNKSGNWIKNLAPTKKFIDALVIKITKLNEAKSNLDEKQASSFSQYLTLIRKIKHDNTLLKAVKSLITESKGKFNAFDLQQWLLITDEAARNQLKKLFPNERYKEHIRTQKYVNISTIEKIARKKGGRCYTKNIKNAKSRLHLKCAEGHHFYPTYDSIVYQGTWCPDCHIYIGETICRKFFEQIFNRPFPKSYPPWLINELGNQLELDGYCKEFRLAFEYQGIQHRKKAFGLTDEDVKKIQQEDAYKLKKCKENHVILLQIPDDEIVPYDKMQKYIIKQYEEITKQTLNDIPQFDYHEFVIHENKPAKKFREYVESKGGTLMTPYFSAKKEITIICEHGHKWTTTPNSVYMNNWCSLCAGNVKGTADYFRDIGSKFGCELISDYINAKEPLWFKCSNGHKFKKDPYWLKKDHEKMIILCPKCKMDFYALNFKKFVEKKGGVLITPYKGRFKSITIKCKNNHKWNTTPGAVYQGSWCQTCTNEFHPNKLKQENSKIEILEMLKSIDYVLLSNYENNTKQIRIKCKQLHEFTITPKYLKRLMHQQIEPCPKCRKENLG